MKHLLLALTLLGLMLLAAPLQAERMQNNTIYSLMSEDVGPYVKQQKGYRLVYVFGSWCPYCRKVMPTIRAIGQQGSVKVIAISTEIQRTDLEKYMVEIGGATFPVILVEDYKKGDTAPLQQSLSKAKLRYTGGIPYVAVISPGHKTLYEGNPLSEKFIPFMNTLYADMQSGAAQSGAAPAPTP